MNYYVSNSELYHFGIKGQKWGVRRYQNDDGTLTAAGKKRYSDYENGVRASSETKKAYKRIEKLKKIGASDDDIRKANENYEKSKSRDIDAHRYKQLKKNYSTDRMDMDELEFYNAHKQAEVYKKMDNKLTAEARAKKIKIVAGLTVAAAATAGAIYIKKHPEVLTKVKDKAVKEFDSKVVQKGKDAVSKVVDEAIQKTAASAKEAPKVVASAAAKTAEKVATNVQKGIKYGGRSDEEVQQLHDRAKKLGQAAMKRAIMQGKTREEAQAIAKRTAADALEKLLNKT